MRTEIALSLGIESPLVTQASGNYKPPTWPPPKDFPVVIDKNGEIVSRYGDSKWDLTPWIATSKILNFGDGPQRKGDSSISSNNADLFRQVIAWWLWGARALNNANNIHEQYKVIRPIFILCSDCGISASDLVRYPVVAEQIPSRLNASTARFVFLLLHDLLAQHDKIGFTLLDREGLRKLEAALPDNNRSQTPYIPPRIWTYQIRRLRNFLDDFHAHKEKIIECYHFCLDAYAKVASPRAEAVGKKNNGVRISPFKKDTTRLPSKKRALHVGPFASVARRFQVDGLLERWKLTSGQVLDDSSIRIFASYLTMVSWVSTAYLLNLSMMRISEAWSLRSDCFEKEKDDCLGVIYLLRGETSKTIEDDNAQWVTAESTQLAVDAATCVARLRMIAAEANPAVPTTRSDVENPFLVTRAYEPWANTFNEHLALNVRHQYPSYQDLVTEYPCLFDLDELRITEIDLQYARLVTPTICTESFAVGEVWPLAWHQLRRTGAVNMQASGLVSEFSVQYQLKHAACAMSLYYGQGYSSLRLNQSARTEYIEAMYSILGKEIAQLFTDRYVSPHGVERKVAILKPVDPSDNRKLVAAAKSGNVSWRETLLGGCTRRGPCQYGGIDNIVRCGGGDHRPPCADALYDREKVSAIQKLNKVIDSRLLDAPHDSPYRESLVAQQRAIGNALNVLATK